MNQFARALRTLGAACMDAASILESSNQPQIAPERRKRGRPRKSDISDADKAIALARAESEAIELREPYVAEFKTCDLCGREIPADALSIHHINCAAAQAGYWDQK